MVLLPATALFSWWSTRRMMHSDRFRRLWLTIIIIVDLAPLLYFKYTNFFISTINSIVHSNFAPLDLLLPVGISFYTFQAISYSIDVYKWKFTSETPLPEYLFYLTLLSAAYGRSHHKGRSAHTTVAPPPADSHNRESQPLR